MRTALVIIALVLLASPAHAMPTWPEPPGCGCSWGIEIPPLNTEPDPPQTYEQWIEDLAHEPPPAYTLVCEAPEIPPISTPEPSALALLLLGLVALKGRR